MFYIRIDEVSGFGIAVTAVQVVEPSFVIVIIASVAKWILESKRPLPCFCDPDEFRPEIIAIVYHNDSLSVNYSDDVTALKGKLIDISLFHKKILLWITFAYDACFSEKLSTTYA